VEDQDVLTVAKKGEIILKVSNTTDLQKLSFSIQRNVEEGARVIVSCVGTQTINQAVKAVAIANGKTVLKGFVLLLLPTFHSENRGDENVEYTVMRFVIIKHLIGG
jgi:stage V sporulation protein SpoVS